MSTDNSDKRMSDPRGWQAKPVDGPDICVLVGHSIEAITSAVVLASLGQCVHLYADKILLAQQLEQYGFEHHLQALWQMYEQQQLISHHPLPNSADQLLQRYDKTGDGNHNDTDHLPKPASVVLYWLFRQY